METRIEIFTNGEWRRLTLKTKEEIKYNALINSIGKINSREISHTNTFEIPLINHNTQILGFNIFNPELMAKALNVKFIAKYYVEDKLLQIGFLVINNTRGGTISVNFIDQALDITSQWSFLTYRDLLNSGFVNIPSDYQTAISELQDYTASKVATLPFLSTVGSRGYNLATYPNNLNSIGDKFQRNDTGTRIFDKFNPYQNRPIYNVKAFLDMICEAFGYTPIYDAAVDWQRVERTGMIASDMLRSDKPLTGLQTITHPAVATSAPYDENYDSGLNRYNSWTNIDFASLQGRYPGTIPQWTTPPFVSSDSSLLYRKAIYYPKIGINTTGTIQVTAGYGLGADTPIALPTHRVSIAWTNTTPGDPVVHRVPTITDNSTLLGGLDITINKSEFGIAPTNGQSVIGLTIIASHGFLVTPLQAYFNLATVTETYTASSGVSFDESGQFVADSVDMTFAAPEVTISKLLSGIMNREGLLINIDNKNKEIKFFTYGSYKNQKSNGIFNDWSKYFQRNTTPEYNTDYGSSYAKNNTIGLSSPFPGNTYLIELANQGADSKYKDAGTDFNKTFKDVENVSLIPNATQYFEYENKGLGLVEDTQVTMATLQQIRADGITQGNLIGITSWSNVNYGVLPNGVHEWYALVDKALRITGEFLVPVEEIRNLDLSIPIYIEDLGGYYIIEEVQEYTNATTVVNVKLIKLLINDVVVPPVSDITPPNIGVLSIGIIDESSITIDWTAATDNFEVTNYEIYVGGVLETTVGNVLTFTLSGLAQGVSKTFKIIAKDAAGNSSSFSNQVVGKTLDIVAPTIGVLFPGTIDITTIELVWTAASDNVGVTGYEIYHDGGLVATIGNTLSYTITGLTANSTHLFKIKAFDLAGNKSSFSNELSETTDPGAVVNALPVSNSYSASTFACDATESTTKYSTGTAFIATGDIFYNDDPGTSPFNGNNQYFRISTFDQWAQIGSDGVVITKGGCL